MFTYAMKMEVNAWEVVDVVKRLGKFGLRFDINGEYTKPDELNPNHEKVFWKFTVYGSRRKLAAFCGVKKNI